MISGRRRSPQKSARGGRRYRFLLLLAGLALAWERLWPRLWPALCIVGVFLAVALLDVLPRLADWLHVAILVGFLAALGGALVWALPALRPIHRREARARLERDSGLPDQPLQALEDRLAAGREDLLAETLWRRHRERMAALAGALRVRWPNAEMSRHEPWGVRAGVLILLVVGWTAGFSDPGARLSRALEPGMHARPQQPQVELWITPPAYTRVSPIYLSNTAGGSLAAAGNSAIHVPVGSTLLARVSGVSRPPELLLSGQVVPFQPLGEGNSGEAWRVEAPVERGDRIGIQSGRRDLATWPVSVVSDRPPQVAFGKPPAAEGNGLLLLAWRAADDYGVADISAIITPAAASEGAGEAEGPLRLPLPLGGLSEAEAAGSSLQDLSAHPWAGTPVRIHLEARDVAEQVGTSETVDVVLPERTFTHPVARALVALRKTLASGGVDARYAVAVELGAITAQPESFRDDVVVALALAVAKARLRLSAEAPAIADVRELLWQTALRLEQGDVPLAERQLEEARQQLAEALQRQAPTAEIERLMDALQQALDRFLAAAANDAARRGQLTPTLDPAMQSMNAEDLKDMIDSARQLIRSGSRESAMQMLAQLQSMLDNIRAGLRSGGDEDMLQAQELMRSLRTLADRQQQLQNDSFRRLGEQRSQQERSTRWSNRRPPSPSPPGASTPSGESSGTIPGPKLQRAEKDGGSAEQQALRKELGNLMLQLDEMLGSIPQPLGEADQAMKGAADTLARGQFGEAFANQTQAVDALERAMQSAGKALAQQLGNGLMIGGEGGAGNGDIFGRSAGGRRGFATGDVEIPDGGSLQRAQEILDELRRRAAERSRPVPELDYIDRLLRRF